MSIEATGAEPQSVRRLGVAGVAALGVVFGESARVRFIR